MGACVSQWCVIAGLVLLLVGCDRPSVPQASGGASPKAERHQGYGRSMTGTLPEREAAFFNEIRLSDPSYRTIEKALLNEKNELGLILSPSVSMDSIPVLLRSILVKMAKEFPDQDLTVVAYGPSNPPLEIGTARFDARTRETSYTPSQNGRI